MNKENEGPHYSIKLKNIIDNAKYILDNMNGSSDLPAWIKDKIVIADHNMIAIKEYMLENLNDDELEEAYAILEKGGRKHGIYEIDAPSALEEAEYQGRDVQLGKVMKGDVKKFKVYVKNPEGRVVKVNFGQKGMRIKKDNPERRKSFRARHNCDNPGPRHKARYWACKSW